MIGLIEFFRKRKLMTAIIWLVMVAILAIWGAFMVDTSHAHTEMEKIPFFWSAFGLIGCAVLILVSRLIGSLGIMTREDYYDE